MNTLKNAQTALVAAVLIVGALAFSTGVLWERTRSTTAFNLATPVVQQNYEVLGVGGKAANGTECAAPDIASIEGCINAQNWTRAQSQGYLGCINNGADVQVCSCEAELLGNLEAEERCTLPTL